MILNCLFSITVDLQRQTVCHTCRRVVPCATADTRFASFLLLLHALISCSNQTYVAEVKLISGLIVNFINFAACMIMNWFVHFWSYST